MLVTDSKSVATTFEQKPELLLLRNALGQIVADTVQKIAAYILDETD